MDSIHLSCGQCGAPIALPAGTRYASCSHCGSRLAVRQGDGALFTEVIERVERRVESVSEDVAAIRRQNELERLDREWQMERETYLTTGEHGQRSGPPTTAGAIFFLGVFIVFAIMFVSIAGSMLGGSSMLPLVILFLVGMGAMVVYNIKRASDYEQREADYQSRRQDLVRQLGGGFRDVARPRRSRPAPLDTPPVDLEPRDPVQR